MTLKTGVMKQKIQLCITGIYFFLKYANRKQIFGIVIIFHNINDFTVCFCEHNSVESKQPQIIYIYIPVYIYIYIYIYTHTHKNHKCLIHELTTKCSGSMIICI